MSRRPALLLAALLPAGCGIFGDDEELAARVEQRRKALQTQLRDVVRSLSAAVETAGHDIAVRSPDLATKRLSLDFRRQIVQRARATLAVDDPVIGWIDLWALCRQYELHLTQGAGRELFGEQQQLAVTALQEAVGQIEQHMQLEVFDHDTFARVRQSVDQFAVDHPIYGVFGRTSVRPSDFKRTEQAGGGFELLPFEINPFATVGAGISETAAAIYRFERTADRFNDVVELLPQQLSWQLEGQRYDLEQAGTFRAASDAVTQVGTAVESIATTADRLPERLRAEAQDLLAATTPQLAELRATLGAAETTAATVERTVAQIDAAAGDIDQMAAQVTVALQTFQQLMTQLEKEPAEPPPPPEERSPPFDVLEYDQTARSITSMAAQLDTTLQSFRALLGDERLDARVAAVSGEASASVRGVIWTVAAALGAIVLLIGLVTVVARRARRPQPAAP
jgi:hypothetical protein